ncbi:hypothetical protein AAEP93_006859 [Penicillium crustosum]
MVTENVNPRYPPPSADFDLPGRRRVPHPPRLESLVEPRARTANSGPRSSPHSPRSTHRQRSRSPLPQPHNPHEYPWPPTPPHHGSSQGTRGEWNTPRPTGRPQLYATPPETQPSNWAPRDEYERPMHRKPMPARGGLRISMSTSRLNNRRPRTQESMDRRPQDLSPQGVPLSRFPTNGPADENNSRPSVNSSDTWRSSIEQASGTERSSVLTKSSSITDLSPDTPDAPYGMDNGMSVEDAISMYLDGFSDVTEEPGSPKSHTGSKAPSVTPPPSRDSHLDEREFPSLSDVPPIPPMPEFTMPQDTRADPLFLPNLTYSEPTPLPPILPESPPEFTPLEPTLSEHSELDPSDSGIPDSPRNLTPSPSPPSPVAETPEVHHVHQRQASKKVFIPGLVPPQLRSGNGPRDDYGFRKATQYVSLDEYETWKGSYSNHVTQRRAKWCELLKEHGLPTSNPTKFPPQSSKVKRFVRKGIPPEFRGAAWFYYAGGYELLNRNLGQYDELVGEAMSSPSNDDKEHIERDLHRTFPDNLHFKPEVTEQVQDSGSNPNSSNVTTETQMIQSLRRVLYAYALHNPKIGYTQSLNFITGMLLLFLPEEKAFWMLHIIAADYLPGTHEISLEGANIDLWILMVLLRDSMPGIYSKIAAMGGTPSGRGKMPPLTVNSRLPDITLGLTNWLMSVFIGSLPLETTLRVWDVFFYEGSKTFFRVSLAIFKACEKDILGVTDPMEAFQIVQTIPKKLLDANALMDECFVRRHRVGQGRIEELRAQRRTAIREEKLRRSVAFGKGQLHSKTDEFTGRSRTPIPGIEHRVVGSWRHLKQHAFR